MKTCKSYQEAYTKFLKEDERDENFAYMLRSKFYTPEELEKEATQQMNREEILMRIFNSFWAIDAEFCSRNPRLAAYAFAVEL